MLMMSFLKQVAGACVFVVAFGASAALAIFYGFISVPQFDGVEMPAVVGVEPATVEVPLSARFVMLDFEHRKSYTTLELARNPHQPAPDKLHVWTYFFTPEGAARREIWSAAPVELTRPFDASDTARLHVEAACTFCNDSQAPRSGYYARVYLTTDARPPINPGANDFDFDIMTATHVLVQAATAAERR
jgi:hypothetical protein